MSYKLSNRFFLAYAMPVVTTSWLMAPASVLQGIYAKYFGLSLTTIAGVLLLTRLFDAVSDPLIGYWADRYYQRSGTYKPFIFVGGLLLIVSSYFLYVPPIQVGAVYFTLWLVAFYFSWTLFEMPHLAWASELAQTSEDKTLIYSFRNMAGYTGLLLFYTIPLLPIFETRSITPETLKVSVIVAGSLLLFLLTMCLKTKFTSVHLTSHQSQTNSAKLSLNYSALPQQQPLRKFLLSLLKNEPLLIFIGTLTMISIGNGMWYGLIFLYVDAYLGLGNQFAQMFLLAVAIGIFSTPLWCKLTLCLGKKTVWMLATLLLFCSFISTGFLSPSDTSFTALVLIKATQTLGFAGMGIAGPAVLSEIIDYSQWKYGTENRATYFSIYTFMLKSNIAIAAALGLSIAGWYGFDATATRHSAHSIFGLNLAIAWLPSLFSIMALVLIFLSPINERRHRIIRRCLDARALRASRKI